LQGQERSVNRGRSAYIRGDGSRSARAQTIRAMLRACGDALLSRGRAWAAAAARFRKDMNLDLRRLKLTEAGLVN
jgi:hypothetical protein